MSFEEYKDIANATDAQALTSCEGMCVEIKVARTDVAAAEAALRGASETYAQKMLALGKFLVARRFACPLTFKALSTFVKDKLQQAIRNELTQDPAQSPSDDDVKIVFDKRWTVTTNYMKSKLGLRAFFSAMSSLSFVVDHSPELGWKQYERAWEAYERASVADSPVSVSVRHTCFANRHAFSDAGQSCTCQ
jgi:hypothetical protein